jgi:NADH:ubiquinone oxidoreductase subunit H
MLLILKIKYLNTITCHMVTCQVWCGGWEIYWSLIAPLSKFIVWITCHTIAFRFILGFSTLLYTKKKSYF